jgi:hypothetical protein
VLIPDHCDSVAERQGGRSGGGVWRHGVADGFRPARFGDAAVEGDDYFGRGVHGDVDNAIDHGDEGHWIGRRNGIAAASGEDVGSSDSGTGSSSYGSRAGNTCSRDDGSANTGSAEEVKSNRRICCKFAPIAEVAELADALA